MQMIVAKSLLIALCTALVPHVTTAVVLRGNAEHIPKPKAPAKHRKRPSMKKLSRLGYAQDCTPASKRPHSMSALEWQESMSSDKDIPGVGMDLSALNPYTTVYKDGFYYVTCAKDILFHHGDKHGNGKFDYNLGSHSNVSIVHYTDVVAKEDQELMTHEVCFSFCRTLQHMNFFGIHDGRDCYCAPFFNPEAGDSSLCDAVCEGDATTMCGGMVKSALFEMHMCDSMGEDLAKDVQAAEDLSGKTTALGNAATALSAEMQAVAEAEQKMFGLAGDPNAAALMQTTKDWAGQIAHAAEPALEACTALNTSIAAGQEISSSDFSSSKAVVKAEGVIEDLEKGMAKVKTAHAPLQEVYDDATRGVGDGSKDAHQYYPLMYFVDKTYLDSPSTCSGDWDGRTIFKADESDCAAACDQEMHHPECVGFMLTDTGLCFLFSKFKTVQYYTGCGHSAKPSFLQGPADLNMQLLNAEADEEHAHELVAQLKSKIASKSAKPSNSSTSSDASCQLAQSCSWTPPPAAKSNIKPSLLQGRFGLRYVDLTFDKSTIAINNLDGKDKSKDKIALIKDVGDNLNLKIETTNGKYVGNGVSMANDGIVSVNMDKGNKNSQIKLRFTFVAADTGKPVTLDYFEYSMFDLDGTNKKMEIVQIGGFEKYFVDADSPVTITEASDGEYKFQAYSVGYGCDNPADPNNLIVAGGGKKCTESADAGLNQKYASVGFTFVNTAHFDMTFKFKGDSNRNFLFAFPSQLTKQTKCFAKLEDFSGTDLSPDPSGKDKFALKEAKKAERCYK